MTFIEPHGLLVEGQASGKVPFHRKIREIERHLSDPEVILNSFVPSWTRHARLNWGPPSSQLEQQHTLFMTEERASYVTKMFRVLA